VATKRVRQSFFSALWVCAASFVLASCSSASSVQRNPGPISPAAVVRREPSGPQIVEYTVPTANSGLRGIAAGKSAVWFAEMSASKIASISSGGQVTEYSLPAGLTNPTSVAADIDGDIWFVAGTAIGRFDQSTSGIVPYPPVYPFASLYSLTTSPSGGAFYIDRRHAGNFLGHINAAGKVSEDPTLDYPDSIVAMPDKDVWVSGQRVSNYPLDICDSESKFNHCLHAHGGDNASLGSVTLGPDGNFWYTVDGVKSQLGRISLLGNREQFSDPLFATFEPLSIVAGSDGALWFVGGANYVGQITTAGVITIYRLPSSNARPLQIVSGSDGNLWITEPGANQIAEVLIAAGR
jgi:virginiamycin B lyase